MDVHRLSGLRIHRLLRVLLRLVLLLILWLLLRVRLLLLLIGRLLILLLLLLRCILLRRRCSVLLLLLLWWRLLIVVASLVWRRRRLIVRARRSTCREHSGEGKQKAEVLATRATQTVSWRLRVFIADLVTAADSTSGRHYCWDCREVEHRTWRWTELK